MIGLSQPVPEFSAEHFALLNIGGVTLGISGRRSVDVVLDAEHEPFRVEIGRSDVHVRVDWVNNLESIPCRPVFDSGTTWQLYESDDGFRFDFGDRIGSGHIHKRLFVNDAFKDGTLQVNARYFAPFPRAGGALAYPLDELLIMHRLTQEKAIELHGSGIVRADGIGNLFVGHSGAGKSTTTRLWTEREDVEVLSDDRIIVRRDEVAVGTPLEAFGAASEHEVLRLRDRSASPTSHFAQDDKAISARDDKAKVAQDDKVGKKMRMYGTPWHGEAMYASPNSAPLARIFVLEHGHGNVIMRLTPSQAVAELFARSFVPFHRHEYVDSALEFLQELVDAVPVYRYAFEPDGRAVDKIIHFHD